jgi:hypothetical protein
MYMSFAPIKIILITTYVHQIKDLDLRMLSGLASSPSLWELTLREGDVFGQEGEVFGGNWLTH